MVKAYDKTFPFDFIFRSLLEPFFFFISTALDQKDLFATDELHFG